MRISLLRAASFALSVALAACAPGRVIIVRQPPPPPPPPPRVEPLEITVARPVRGHLIVQTNRPSYVALFEIVPDRGVALLAPAYAHQRTWMLAGLNWIPVSWKLQSAMYYGPPSGRAIPARWVYAIASDEPLRLPDEAFHPAYMRRVLGAAAYRGTNPYLTMRAISRAFVPSVVDEMWAEDAYALAATYVSDPYRTVRIYCANRTMYEVPEELADRAWCPVRTVPGGTIVRSAPTRPDSIVAGNGQRVRRRLPDMIPVRTPVDRVHEPTPPEHAPITTDNNAPRNDTNRVLRDAKDVRKATKERRGNGNAYGHTDDPNVKGRGIENEKRNDPRREPRVDQPVTNQPESQPAKVDAKQEKHDEKQARQEEKQLRHEEQHEDKQLRREEKQEEKVEKVEKVEQKVDRSPVTIDPPREPDMPVVKTDVKPDVKPDKKDEERSANPDDKPETKAEVKAEKKEEKVDAKSEDKSGGKPEEKSDEKSEAEAPPKKDRKGKP